MKTRSLVFTILFSIAFLHLNAQNGKLVVIKDSLIPIVIPQSDYVLLGQEYKADIFLGVTKPKSGYQIKINGQDLPIENGVGKLITRTDAEGAFLLEGKINTTIGSQTKVFTFHREYQVFPAAFAISNDYSNFLYVGLDNSISIAVAGFAPQSVIVSLRNGNITKLAPNRFIAKVMTPGKVTIQVSVKLQDGKVVSVGEKEFIAIKVPQPEILFGNLESGTVSTDDLLAQDSIKVRQTLSKTYYNGRVISYSIRYIHINGTSEFSTETSPAVSDRLKELIKAGQTGDIILIENADVQWQFGRAKPKPMVLIVK